MKLTAKAILVLVMLLSGSMGTVSAKTLTRAENDSVAAALATVWGDYIKKKVATETKEVSAEYMRGLDAAMKYAAGGNDAFYRGLAEGVMMNNRIEQVEELGRFEVNRDRFMYYMSQIAKGRPSGFTPRTADSYMTFLMTKIAEEAKIVDGSAAYLDEQSKKEGVVKMPSGLLFEVVTEGEGDKPGPTDMVLVNYKGSFIDGSVFNQTDEGKPMVFEVDKTIKGFGEGLQLMKKGGRYRLYIPSSLGYDAEGGVPGLIPVGAATVFDVELLDIRHVEPDAESAKE